MKRRNFLMRLAIGAGIINVTPAPSSTGLKNKLIRHVVANETKSPPFDPWHGVTTFLRENSIPVEWEGERKVCAWVEEAPIEEHHAFDEICRLSAFQRERAQRLGILPEGVSGDVSASAEVPKGIS